MTDIQSPSRPYTYAASDAAFARAAKVIPGGVYGHLSPTEGMHIPRSAFPKFSSHAQGTRFWDLDGNEFIVHVRIRSQRPGLR